MAGEIEEHFSDSFRSDSLHSGSISFGRFEHEELSWERRSLFSHNRYLEEVEKYSKPGSVTEKKAYFEAHFKKKGMKLPGGFICTDQRGSQSNDNDVFVSVDHKEQDDYVNGRSKYTHFDRYSPHNLDHVEYDYNNGRDGVDSQNYDGHQAYYDDGPDFDSQNYDGHRAYYDDSLEGSEYHVQVEWKDHEREDLHSVSTEALTGTALDAAKVLVEGLPEGSASKGTPQTETICEKSQLDNESQEMDIKGNLDNNDGNVGEFSGSVDPSHKSEASEDVEKSSKEAQQKQSPKLKTTEMKAAKPRLKSPVNANKAEKNGDVPKASSKNHNSKERESPSRKDLEKPSTESSVPARTPLFKTPRKENSGSHSRTSLPSKSERESRAKKPVETPQSGSKRSEATLSHSTNRLKQHASSSKLDTRSSASKFSFKSDERAEKRKEFFMKLEAKMHAKEAEMNHIQAKTQEKAEAEIKQFRKSLNFKATPMPPFYHSTTTPDSAGKKIMQSKAKSSKEREKLSSPGSKLATKSPSNSKAGSDNRSTTPESMKTPNPPEHLEFTNSTTGESSDACQATSNKHSEVRNQFVDMERQKVNDKSQQNSQASENGKTSKEQRVQSKQMKRTPNERRNMKGVGMGGNSGMGHLTVGVAS